MEVLDEAAARGLPLVCANPDKVVARPGGVLAHMPGAIADASAARGADNSVTFRGANLQTHASLQMH